MIGRQILTLGKISVVFGVKGWVKVYSYTEPRESILTYSPWLLSKGGEVKEINVVAGNRHGKTVVAHLQGVEDCDAAQLLNGWEIAIDKRQLPEVDEGEYYWADLVGLQVFNLDGVDFVVVDHLRETGANDVLVVKGDQERLIPFLQQQTVLHIDLVKGVMTVDWDVVF